MEHGFPVHFFMVEAKNEFSNTWEVIAKGKLDNLFPLDN